MNEKLKNLLIKFKKLVIFILVFMVTAVIVRDITRTVFTLNIIATPNDSLITVTNSDEIHTSTGTFSKNLKSDIYNLKIEKNGYITEQRQIKLDKNNKISISLFQSLNTEIDKSYTPIKVSPIVSNSGFENGTIYGINRKNGNLIKFMNNKEVVVYGGNVEDYDIKGNIAVILDSSNLTEIIILNLDNLSQKVISEKQLAPIVSVALSEDMKDIYFLGEFEINDKVSSLNTISVSGSNLRKITDTGSQSVKVLKGNLLTLFTENHNENENIVKIYDLNKNIELLTEKTNKYSVSPDNNNVFLHRTKDIEIIDTNSFKSKLKSIQSSSRSTWKDNNTIVILRNDEGNIYYSVLTIEPFNLSPFKLLIEKKSVLNVFGFVENRLFMQDYEEKIFSVDISLNDI